MVYDNPGGIIAAAVILEMLAVTCVVLRFVSSIRRGKEINTSDWLILAAVICSTGLTVMEIYGIDQKALAYPLGATLDDPAAVDGRLNKAKHIELAFLLLGILTLGLIKLSITFLYWYIFNKMKFRRVLVVWMILIIVWTVSFVLAGLLECGSHLLALFSTPQSYLQHCGSAIPTGWAMVGGDVATDIGTLIIPIPMVLSLKMSTRKKALALATFMIGSLSVGASVAKAYIYISASKGYYKSDALLTLTALSVWNLVEVQVGIIAVCAVTLRKILGEILPKSLSQSSSLASLIGTLRHPFTNTRRTTSANASTPSSYIKTISDENLVPPNYNSGQTKVSTGDIELQPSKPGVVHIGREFAVESV